ncbi:MAG: TIGR04255 family protein [Sedimentisphaerales bacterium]
MAVLIDLTEKFSHLSQAPIVEAVIAINVIPSVKWNETSLQNELKKRIPDFPKVEPLRYKRYQLPMGEQNNPIIEDLGCVGFKVHSIDNLHIAQFNKDAFVFSRLKPYEDWGQLSGKALRLLAIYRDLLKPTEVTRIGLRFINRIAVKQEKIELSDYYKYPPEPLKELDWMLAGYLHHDVMQVPGTSYSVNLIKTIQDVPGEIGLILDIDVFMRNPFEYNEQRIKERLEEMRWVKNKIFFSSMTDKVLEDLK